MIWLAVGILLLFRRRKEEMPLNIKNERVSHLATQVAAETGESITDAVGVALEERLKSLRRQKQREGLADRLMELGRRCASHAPAAWLTRNFDEELYDAQGLPR